MEFRRGCNPWTLCEVVSARSWIPLTVPDGYFTHNFSPALRLTVSRSGLMRDTMQFWPMTATEESEDVYRIAAGREPNPLIDPITTRDPMMRAWGAMRKCSQVHAIVSVCPIGKRRSSIRMKRPRYKVRGVSTEANTYIHFGIFPVSLFFMT